MEPDQQDLFDPAFLRYLEFESRSTRIRGWQMSYVPGLLQTEDYARAQLERVYGYAPSRVEAHWRVRALRQELHGRAERPELHYVIDGSVLSRPLGGRGVLRAQVRHLLELAQRDRVTVQVAPVEVGEHGGLRGSFTLLELAGSGLLYTEHAEGETVTGDPDRVSAARSRFGELVRAALSPRDTLNHLDRRLRFLSVVTEDLAWQRASAAAEGDRVELASLPDGEVAVRHGGRPEQGVLFFTDREFAAFRAGVLAGEFD